MKHDDWRSPFIVSNIAHPQGKRNQCWECARPVCTAQRKTPRSLLINDNCTIKWKTLLSACSRMMGSTTKNNVLFTPSLLKIRVRRFVLCLYSHNYFEQEIKNAVFSLSLLRFLDDVLVRTWKNDHATHLCRCEFWEGKVPVGWHSII